MATQIITSDDAEAVNVSTEATLDTEASYLVENAGIEMAFLYEGTAAPDDRDGHVLYARGGDVANSRITITPSEDTRWAWSERGVRLIITKL